MIINEKNPDHKIFVSMSHATKAITSNIEDISFKRTYIPTDSKYHSMLKIVQICRKRSYDDETKNRLITKWLKSLNPAFTDGDIELRLFDVSPFSGTSSASTSGSKGTGTYTITYEELKSKIVSIISLITKFFSEFTYTPSFRFINKLFTKTDNIQEYVINYFSTQNHVFAKEIADKVKSVEFKDICRSINDIVNNIDRLPEEIKNRLVPKVNSRLVIYIGEPGTGKTTSAMLDAVACMICSSDMLPADLLTYVNFVDGKPVFSKSPLWIAMEKGQTIVLDEVNMLNFESLRFLQGLTDNKEYIDFKDSRITIHPDFKIIGTMNLNVGGQCIPLPAPLVDRCEDICEYKLSPELLARAVLN